MEELLTVLKEVTEKFKPQIIGNTRKAIDKTTPGYLSLFDYVLEIFYSEINPGGRWYDPYHVVYSTLFAVKLVNAGEAEPLVVPAIVLHDIGYHSLLVDKENWSSQNSRIIHMQEGSGMAAEILITHGGFSASEIGAIVGMVASHDNGYLSIPTTDSDRLAVRDADRAWVMHPLSFYKDWISKKAKKGNLSLSDLFQSRQVSFYQKDKVDFPPFTKLAQEWREEQFQQRFQEIKNNIVGDPDTFRRTIENNIQSELKAGRG